MLNHGLTGVYGAVSEANGLQSIKEALMEKVLQLAKKLAHDEEGAALVEYTVLLGIMLVAVVTTIGLVGGWVSTKWTALWTVLSSN